MQVKATQFKQIRQKISVKKLAISGLFCVLVAIATVLVLPRIEDSAYVPSSLKDAIAQVFPSASSTAAARVPTPVSKPKPLAPASGIGFSVGQSLLSLPDAERNQRLDDMAALGAVWLRFDIEWSDVQPLNNRTYSWSQIDALVDAAHARHIEVLPILLYAPQWARSDACVQSVRCAPKDPAQFAAFAAAAAARYSPRGVHQWEIWNEPNLAASWLPKADATQYTSFLKASYDSIKKVDPNATVVTGGMGPSATRDNDAAPVDFLSAMYKAGAQGNFDAVGFHPYSFPVKPGFPQSWNAWQQMVNTVPSLRSVMAAHKDSAKQIWVTEYGAPTGGPGGVSEDAQASMIHDAIQLWRTYSFAGPILMYTYKDMGTNQDTNENFFGIIRYDGSQKPAYALLKQLLANQ